MVHGDERCTDNIVSFYCYCNILDPEAHVAWQLAIASTFDLLGRCIVATEGVNGTVSGSSETVELYEAALEGVLGCRVDFKRSTASGSRRPFPDFYAKMSREIVSTGIDTSRIAGVEGGKHVTPTQFRATLLGGNAVVLDVRNAFEYDVGHFEGAIRTPIKTMSEFTRWVDSIEEVFAAKEVLLYCTGGVRCEKASRFLKSRGCSEVLQLDGGIVRFLDTFPDGGGVWKGRNFVFDAREIDPPPSLCVVGKCSACNAPWDTYAAKHVCSVCATLVLVCPSCSAVFHEHYCHRHAYLKDSYCHFLDRYQDPALADQERRLEQILCDVELAKRSVNVRRALKKQLARVKGQRARIAHAGSVRDEYYDGPPRCRSCASTSCRGCWGFWKEAQPMS